MKIVLKNYQKILSRVQKIIAEARQKILADVIHEKVLMAWEVGKILEEYLLQNSRADYGVRLFEQLERDVKIPRRALYQMRSFYKTYPSLPKKEKALSWSHYRNLLSVKNEERRKYLEDLTLEKNLKSDELQKKISAAHKKKEKKSPPKNVKLKCERGVLNAYKVVTLQGSEKKFLDCGFNIFTETQGWRGFVTPSKSSAQSKKGNDNLIFLRKLKAGGGL